jgi:hypothetical protein
MRPISRIQIHVQLPVITDSLCATWNRHWQKVRTLSVCAVRFKSHNAAYQHQQCEDQHAERSASLSSTLSWWLRVLLNSSNGVRCFVV